MDQPSIMMMCRVVRVISKEIILAPICGIMVKVTVMTVVTVKGHIVGLFFIPTTARTGRIDGNVDVVTY